MAVTQEEALTLPHLPAAAPTLGLWLPVTLSLCECVSEVVEEGQAVEEGDRVLVWHTLGLGEGVEAPLALCEAQMVVLGLPLAERATVALPHDVSVPLPDAATEREEECEADSVKEGSAEGVVGTLALALSELVRALLRVTLGEGDRVEMRERLPEAVAQPDAVSLCVRVCEVQGLLVWLALAL